jgi:hypothetical protein
MVRRASSLAVIATGLLLLGGGVAPPPAGVPEVYGGVGWLLRPLPVEVTQEVQQKPVGQLLFVQRFAAATEAISSQEFVSPLQNGQAVFPAGSVFREVSSPYLRVRAFCAPRVVAGPEDLFFAGRNRRVCIVDQENDGVFDWLYWNASAASDGFRPMIIFFNRAASRIAIPYTTREGNEPLLSAGLVLTRGFGSDRVGFALSDATHPVVLEQLVRDDTGLGLRPVPGPPAFRDGDLPQSRSLYGAEVEIQSISGNVVNFRLISPFATDATVTVSYGGPLPWPETGSGVGFQWP